MLLCGLIDSAIASRPFRKKYLAGNQYSIVDPGHLSQPNNWINYRAVMIRLGFVPRNGSGSSYPSVP